MSEKAQVGDTVRLTMDGVVYKGESGRLFVNGWYVNAPDRTVEILSRAIPPLPSEPGTWWLDKDDDVWQVSVQGQLWCLVAPDFRHPANVAPFRQLVLKSD